MAVNHELGACSTRVLAADTDPQEAPTTSAKVSAAPFGAAQRNPPKISYGGKKFLNFFWRKQVHKPPNTKAV
ncbi:hypothetical protein [uncultured Rothia sp.]|uniref:hypothetical protein n=1 Tax=uncultured Rothia sp. TaxID=316088 RepID=UPI0025EF3DA2|nr:hypothetical protein [uncultured Rothia sp.]